MLNLSSMINYYILFVLRQWLCFVIFTQYCMMQKPAMGHVKRFFIIFIFTGFSCLACSGNLAAQAGGNNTWEFLNLTNSARIASLGGKNISLRDGDLNMVFHNPALLDSTMDNHLAINYVNYFTDINIGYAAWAYHHQKL